MQTELPFFYSVQPSGRKTLRKWGAVWAYVRSFAAEHRTFSPRDLSAIESARAASACHRLARLGELKIVRPGKRGWRGEPAVYRRAA